VPGSQADVSIKSSGETPQERDRRLGTAFFDALNLIIGHLCSCCQISDAETQGVADVVYGLPEG
jgi:hypothetical protein